MSIYILMYVLAAHFGFSNFRLLLGGSEYYELSKFSRRFLIVHVRCGIFFV